MAGLALALLSFPQSDSEFFRYSQDPPLMIFVLPPISLSLSLSVSLRPSFPPFLSVSLPHSLSHCVVSVSDFPWPLLLQTLTHPLVLLGDLHLS